MSACETPGEDLKANVYTADQVNSRQAANVVDILAVLPARVQVDNTRNQQSAQIIGGLMGAAAGGFLGGGLARHNVLASGTVGAVGGGLVGAGAGSLVPGTILVDGVSLTYVDHGQTYSSTQVGAACEYMPGHAIMIETTPTTTRIQANTTCPVLKKA
ncbi:hypothetical protein [Lichenicoccus sp.]|uniref:hypothetical protein n=1 Tax=Lichenicoccus sp. TaxID=2781899 RepID=UPI003D151145